MTLIDISVVTGVGTPEWPGDTPFACGWSARIADGSSVNLTTVTASPHVGTHADAPLHVRDGAAGVEGLPLGAFVGRVVVLGVEGAPRDLGDELLARVPAGTERLLLRTGVSIATGTFPTDWPALGAELARALTAGGLRLLGVDAPSVDRRESKALDVHHALFDGGACVLENLDLRAVAEGEYELIAPPMRWIGVDAAPVRAVLRVQGSKGGKGSKGSKGS
ncbi:MAG: kynurenine formamidase [Gemmatimonadaceae bacterium]|nr:kynurenine formamidase [Gemmatimonadaceae bacterium]